MDSSIVTGFFGTYDVAKQAVHELEAAGIRSSDISIVANNSDYRVIREPDISDGTAAATGASIGTVVGGSAGLLAGLGVLTIPGIGPVIAAGWLASTALGAAVGAATGGIIGALTDAGMSEDEAEYYAEGIRRGGTLVTVKISRSQAATVEGILARNYAIDPETKADLRKRSATSIMAREADRERTRIRETGR